MKQNALVERVRSRPPSVQVQPGTQTSGEPNEICAGFRCNRILQTARVATHARGKIRVYPFGLGLAIKGRRESGHKKEHQSPGESQTVVREHWLPKLISVV